MSTIGCANIPDKNNVNNSSKSFELGVPGEFNYINTVNLTNNPVKRIYGSTRYETSYAIADELKNIWGVEKFNNIIVASGVNFPDALSGSYLSNIKKAPIILVDEKYIDYTVNYIKNNLYIDGTIYILGGVNAVPYQMENELKEYNTKRIFGNNRYETNSKILEEAGIYNDEILVCTGTGYADSISASAVGKPIMLVGNHLTDLQRITLSDSYYKFIIIGGTSAVSKDIENELKEYGTVERINGASRYETSILVAKRFFNDASSIVLTYSHNFPDGLCGGILANTIGAPILLTSSCFEKEVDIYAEEYNITSGIILGGNSSITNESANIVFTDADYIGHNYIVTTIEATTGWGGYDYHECSICGHYYTDNETKKLSANEWPKGYRDDTCTITVYKKWYYNAWCYIAHLEFSDYTRFGSVLAHDRRGAYETTSSVAKRLNAILCVNGPYNWGELKNAYAIVRSGVVYNDIGIHEDLCIYNSATGILKNAGELGISRKLASTAVNEGLVTDTFKFWNSTVVKNGENVADANSNARAQRTFIATNGEPGDIYLIVAEGRYVDGKSSGLTHYECANVILNLGCSYGVMLDGGGSSTMYFNGTVLNSARSNERAVVDFLYFK